MPIVNVVFYKDDDETIPMLDWLVEMGQRDQRIVDKCRVAIEELANSGHELRRPKADYLRDDIYELRIRFQSVNYRILYFFHGRTAAILAHGLTKEDVVPEKAINLAVERRKKYVAKPEEHQGTSEEEDEENE